jgi:hypothetical protein
VPEPVCTILSSENSCSQAQNEHSPQKKKKKKKKKTVTYHFGSQLKERVSISRRGGNVSVDAYRNLPLPVKWI